MQNSIPLEPGHYYHIYNRGNNRENIFFEERNFRYFMQLYQKYILPACDTLAYCLMRNHFHLLVRVKESPAQTSEVSETSEVSKQASDDQTSGSKPPGLQRLSFSVFPTSSTATPKPLTPLTIVPAASFRTASAGLRWIRTATLPDSSTTSISTHKNMALQQTSGNTHTHRIRRMSPKSRQIYAEQRLWNGFKAGIISSSFTISSVMKL
jgi:hypothetical protein